MSRSLPACRISEGERPTGPGDPTVVGDRRVVWSTGSAAVAVRTRGRRRLLQRVGFVAASAAAVATLASVVSTWSIISPVGSDPAAALWIAPVSEVDVGSTTRPASTLVSGTVPDARSAFPDNSPLTRPSAQPATLVADSAAGSGGSGSTEDPDQSGPRWMVGLDATTTYEQDSGADHTGAQPGRSSRKSEPAPDGDTGGSDGGRDDSETGPIIGSDNGQGSDRRSERPSTTRGEAGTGAKPNGRPDSSDLSNLGPGPRPDSSNRSNLGSPAGEPGISGAGSGDSGRARSDRAHIDALDCVEVKLSAPGAPRRCGRSGLR
jgi:hypothetical protein